MQTVEAIVDANGTLRIVGDVRLPKNRRALVTVLDEQPPDAAVKKERLIAAFKKAEGAGLFKDIEDPVEWQRKLRDEWE